MGDHNAYRDGRSTSANGFVTGACSALAISCAWRRAGLATMVVEARANESAIICHSTLYRNDVNNAVCRGFYDRHRTQPLQIAERLDLVVFDAAVRAAD